MKRRRIIIDVTEEEYQLLLRIPWGERQPVFRELVSDMLKAMSFNAPAFIAGVVSRRIKLSDFSKLGDPIDEES